MQGKTVLIGMSGGVDSAVSALLLKQQGYEAVGGTFRLWDGPAADCDDARAICGQLGIPHHVFDFRERFRREVMEYFAGEYRHGRTPNPCVVCNRRIKFGAMLEEADRLGCRFAATGHYARMECSGAGLFRARRAGAIKKDQSYVLWQLGQPQLSRALFPLGELDKPAVRRIAEENNLAVSRKAESQDICFIPDGDYAAFLRGYLGADCPPGDFVDEQGNILGRHRGIWHYTVGQRKGLGISFAQPMFVSAVDARSNTVTLCPNERLLRAELRGEHANWICGEPSGPVNLTAKIRYAAEPAACVVTPGPDRTVTAVFDTPQRAITPGQSVVFYDGEFLAGGAVIV